MDDDCAATKPICEHGSCRGCIKHDECESGVCQVDGTCALPNSIAYADPNGSSASDCTRISPCTLPRAIATNLEFVLLAAGNYSSAGTITVGGTRSLIGSGSQPTGVTNTMAGPVISIAAGGDVTLEHLRVFGATGTTSAPFGQGIECPTNPNGTRFLRLKDVEVADNALDGVFASRCTVDVVASTFKANGGSGLRVVDGSGTIDRSLAEGNASDGFLLDAGTFTVRNSFAVRNSGVGIEMFGNAGSAIEFSTVADNTQGGVGGCGNPGVNHKNNIIARNGVTDMSSCTLTSSIITATVADLGFKSADAAPFDYHLTAASIAIDAAVGTTNDHDFDGQARPNGAGRDVGADEFVP